LYLRGPILRRGRGLRGRGTERRGGKGRKGEGKERRGERPYAPLSQIPGYSTENES